MNRSEAFRNLLRHPLMRSCLIEIRDVRMEDALELLLLKDQQMIQTFLSDTPQKTLADGIGSWGKNRRFEDLDRARFHHTSKTRPKLPVVTTNEILGRLSIGCSFSQVLRHPGIGWRACIVFDRYNLRSFRQS